MNKYIITQDQLDDLKAVIPVPSLAAGMLESLKPIEFPGFNELTQIYNDSWGKNGDPHKDSGMTFALDIAAHITGYVPASADFIQSPRDATNLTMMSVIVEQQKQ